MGRIYDGIAKAVPRVADRWIVSISHFVFGDGGKSLFLMQTTAQRFMYINKVTIDNIRSIEHLEMEFPNGAEAGWHVLLGANGAGKSTIVRAIAAALIDTQGEA